MGRGYGWVRDNFCFQGMGKGEDFWLWLRNEAQKSQVT